MAKLVELLLSMREVLGSPITSLGWRHTSEVPASTQEIEAGESEIQGHPPSNSLGYSRRGGLPLVMV